MQPSTQRNIRLLIALSVMLTSGIAILVWAIRLEPRTQVAAQQNAPAAAETAIPEGIRIPVELLRVDASGNLLVDAATAQALAFLHAVLLPMDDRGALSRLVNQLRQEPGGEAGHQAATLLIHYHEYQKRMAEMSVSTAAPASPADLEALQQDQARLRAAYFSPGDAKALFSDDASTAELAAVKGYEPRLAGRSSSDQ